MKKQALAALLCVALFSSVAAAQFGIPQVVFDPTQAVNVGRQIAQGIQMIDGIVRSAKAGEGVWQQVAADAVWFSYKAGWRGVPTQVQLSKTASTFGETALWNNAVDLNVAPQAAWQTATEKVMVPPEWSAYELGSSHLMASLATMEATDGAAVAAMSALGNARVNQPLNDQALATLEQTSMDTTDGTNSQVQQMNLIAGAATLHNRQAELTNSLLINQLEMQLVQNKVWRDGVANNLQVNAQADQYLMTQPANWGGSAATIENYQQ